ncbi:hypothetical protein ACFX5K_06045 [Rickettsiales bacterium LUAb2]
MSFRVNFFPIPYILSLILLIAFVTVFNETVYVYLSSNFIINGAICVLFVFCSVWILGALSYFARSARLFSRLLRTVGPVIEKKPVKGSGKEGSIAAKSMVLKSSSPIAGTLFDSPVVSSMLAKMERKNKLEVSKGDADEIAQSIIDNAARIMAPSRFIASIFILCGLVGTFLGLLDTIGGVARALESLSTGGLTGDISAFIKMLSDPLQGMSTAFSASLFGLTSALISNLGNHLAWERVLAFTSKVRNYLLSNTGVFDEDPVRITARDLLISLEESFDTLYRGLTDRLELLTKHIASMGSVIVKTHERQEKMLKVILKDHELMEQFWRKFLLGTEGVTMIIDEMVRKLSIALPEAMRKVFAPVLEVMLEVMDNNSRMLERAVNISSDILTVQDDIIDIVDIMSEALNRNTDSILQMSSAMISVDNKLNLEQLAGLVEQGNQIKSNMIDLLSENNGINEELNSIAAENNIIGRDIAGLVDNNSKIVEDVVRGIDDNTQAVNTVVSAVDENNNISNQLVELSNSANAIAIDVKGAIDESNSLSNEVLQEIANGNSLNDSILNAVAEANNIAAGVVETLQVSNQISDAILAEASTANAIANDTMMMLDGVLVENNNISRAMLEILNDVSMSSANVVNILDERLGMIIGFSRDILISSENNLMSNNEYKEYMINYYNQLALAARLDNVIENSSNLLGMMSENNSIAFSSNSLMNEITANVSDSANMTRELGYMVGANSEVISQMGNNVAQSFMHLEGINSNIAKFIDDNTTFRGLYIQMERQINDMVSMFSQFHNKFDGFMDNSAMNSNVLQNVNMLTGDMVARISNVAELLSGVAGTLNTLGSVNYEHKELTSVIVSTLDTLTKQEESLNDNIKALSNFLDGGLARIVESIGSVGNISFEFAQMVNQMMEKVIDNTALIPSVDMRIENLHALNKTSIDSSEEIKRGIVSQISEIDGKITNVISNQENATKVNEDVKSVLSNIDSNISGIGNISSSLDSSIEELNKTANTIVDTNNNSLELQKNIQDTFVKTNEDMNKLVEEVKDNLSNIGGVLSNVNKDIALSVNTLQSMDKVIAEISSNTYGRENLDEAKLNGSVLSNIKEEINSLVDIQKEAQKEIQNAFSPILNALGESLYQVIDKLEDMTKTIEIGNAEKASISTDKANNADQILEQYSNIAKVIDKLSSEFKGLTTNIGEISGTISNQRGAIDQLGANISDLTGATKELKELSFNFKDVIGSMVSMKDIVSSLHDKVSSKDSYVYEVTGKVVNDLQNLSSIVEKLGAGFTSEIQRSMSNNREMFTGIATVASEITQLNKNLTNKFAQTNDRDMTKSIDSLNSNVEAIKSVISNTLNTRLNSEISKIAENQQDFNAKLDRIMPYVDELLANIKNIGDNQGLNQAMMTIAQSLDDIKNTDMNNNLKLDLLVKAVDTLISEMLNSRNVSQSILDIIAELGGFKKLR